MDWAPWARSRRCAFIHRSSLSAPSATGTLLPMTQPRLYLVCGLPGAGKTTRVRQIVREVNAVALCVDDWVQDLGKSLVNYEFRWKLQAVLLRHAATLLRHGLSVVIEFGSWQRAEREAIRQVAVREGAAAELHFVHAPLEELAARIRKRGGPEAEALVVNVLYAYADTFEQPEPSEAALFDRYVAPNEVAPSETGEPG